MQPKKLSIVLPVRNAQSDLTGRVTRLLEEISDLFEHEVEVILVDDGSIDGTPELLDELCIQFPQLRYVRHPRALGFEAAGQTGLKHANSELVILAEDDGPIRFNDVQKLLAIGRDISVVAARSQSEVKPGPDSLLRHLRGWGAAVEANQVRPAPHRGLQLVRRPHLDFLASAAGRSAELLSEQFNSVSAQN